MRRPKNSARVTYLATSLRGEPGVYWQARPVLHRAAGLVLTPEYELGWVVSHEATGLQVGRWRSEDAALDALAALATVLDWSGSSEAVSESMAHNSLYELARLVVASSGGTRTNLRGTPRQLAEVAR